MAEHHLPEIDKLIADFGAKMKAHMENLEDFEAAIRGKDNPLEIIDDWEARWLLRQMPDDTEAN